MMNSSDQKQLNNDDEVSLKDFILKIQRVWHYLLKKWKPILIVSLIGGSIGITYSILKKPIYKAMLSFAVENDKGGGSLSLASQFGLDIGGGSSGGAFSGDNLIELMHSRFIIEKALLTTVTINGKKETLAELYISFNKFRDDWNLNPKLKNIQYLPNADRSKFTLVQDSVLGGISGAILGKNLTVEKTDKKLSIINVNVESKNELFSKYFAEVLAKDVSDFYIETKTKKTAESVGILQRQTDSVRRILNESISGLATSIDVAPNLNPTRQILRVPSQKRQIDVSVNNAILSELVKNLEAAKISLRQETPLIQVIDSPILPLEKIRFGKLKGLVIGVVLGGFLSSIVILAINFFKKVMADE